MNFDTPWNSNILSVQSGMSKGWNSTLTSDGSVGWSKEAIAAGKGTESAGVIVSTGLKSDEALTLKLNGRAERIKGDKTWLSLPAYRAYDTEVMNSETGTESYEIGANARRHITVYPGNTVVMKPQVKKIVTLFGRLVDANGAPIGAMQIKNHVGLTRTENDGRFVIDVDKNNPVLSIATPDDSVCEVRPTSSLTAVRCGLGTSPATKAISSGRKQKERRNVTMKKIFALNLLLMSAAAQRRSCPISPLITRTITVRETARGCLV